MDLNGPKRLAHRVSPCHALAADFGQGITEMTTDGSFGKMLKGAMTEWNAQTE